MSSPRGGLRRSRAGSSLGAGSSTAGILFLDMFRRIPKDYRTSSYLGGLLTTVCCCTVTVLVLLEFQAYLTVGYHSAVMFPGNGAASGAEYQPFVSLRFNVTFPHLPCEFMSAEMFDVYGRHAITNSSLTPEKPGTVGEDKVSMKIFKWRVVDEGRRRVGTMKAHVEGNKKTDGSETVHEELPYHHAAHQYRDVVPLTVANFDTFVQSKDVVMVDFYAPWCIWCQRLEPVWENFAHEVTTKDYAEFVGVAKVDCTTETPLCQRRRITGYPSIFLYRDRNPHSHTPYQGDRTTTAFLQFIEGLGVETDHQAEIAEELGDVKAELEAEARRVRLAKHKVREDRADSGVNHPLKSLTAPGGALGPSKDGDAALVGIMRALDKAGGARGRKGAIRISSGGNGNIKIISVRPVDNNDDEKSGAKKDKPLEFHTKSGGAQLPIGEQAAISLDRVKHELAKEAQKKNPSDDGDITVKILPSASDAKLKADKDKELQKKRGESTVPDPGLGGADPNNPGGATKQETPDSKKAAASMAVAHGEAADMMKEVVEKMKTADAKKDSKRRRRLLGVEEGGDAVPQKGSGKEGDDVESEDEDKNRIADSELESRAELFKNTKSNEARQKMWKERVLPLPKDQQRKFTEIVGGAIFAPDGSVPKNQAPVVKTEEKLTTKDKPEPAAKSDTKHVSNTEGCLVYGAIVAEKVPATIRFQAKSKWHNFVSHHIDMSHTVHDFTFGDLTHKLQVRITLLRCVLYWFLRVSAHPFLPLPLFRFNTQEEFAHIKFHEYEGTKMMTTLAPKTYTSEKARATHHHYMRVVGTHISVLGMDSEDSRLTGNNDADELFQYTATSHQYRDTDHLPSAKFTFDFDPMILTLQEEAVPLHRFLTSLMAIVGGVVVMFGMLNSLLQNALLMVSKKN